MNTLLLVIIIITLVFIAVLIYGIVFDSDNGIVIGVVALIFVAILGYVVLGGLVPINTKKVIEAKSNFDIVVSPTKVFITDKKSTKTYIFDDAATYNLITQKKDSINFKFEYKYNMYSIEIEKNLIVENR